LLLCASLLVVAPSLIEGLSWPALMVGLIVALKAYWLALFLHSRAGKT